MIVSPSLGDIHQALLRAIGADRGEEVFQHALAAVGIEDRASVSPVEHVLAVARVIQQQDGLVSLVGLSYVIRCETYVALNAEKNVG